MLKDAIHLITRINLLYNLRNKYTLYFLLHFLCAFLQQRSVGVLLSFGVEGLLLQRDLDGGRGAAVAHADQLFLKVIDASSFLLGELARVVAAVGVIVDLLVEAIAVTEFVAG